MDQKLYSDSAHNISSTGHHDASVLAAAAIRIQNKFRTWKGRKDFLIIRQQIVKIQVHVKGYQVRKNYKEIVWYLGTLEKFILRWRKTGSSLHGFKSEALTRDGSSTLDTSSNEDDFYLLQDGRKQNEEMLQKAPSIMKSMVQDLEARAPHHGLLNTVNKIQGTKFWKEILEDCDPGVGSQHFHPPFPSIQPDTLGNFPKQVHETLGRLSTNSFFEWQEFGTHLPIQRELEGKASTQFADVASESIMDYTNEFSKYKIFKSKEELIECTHEIGRKNGFVIVIKRSDSGNGGQRARITFCCERGGQYRNRSKDKEDKKENTNTKKCACPFELKAYKLSVDDNWELKVKWGVHNHPITKPREGRSYMGSLTKKERLLVEEEFKRKKCTVDILKSLENTNFNNVSTRKHIYNARQRYKVKEMAESSNNTVNSKSFNNFFPVGLRRYIDHCKDVEADGNCGFRAIADLVGFGEKEWLRVKKDLLTELNSKLEDYRLLYGNDERIKELIDALSNFKSRPSFDGWMTMPDMGHLIASAYNVVLIHFSMQQCLTFLPLRSVPVPTDSRKEIAIGFVNNNHFVEV
ncbi:Calmodulin-binding transcription activator 2 [Melia azedarach]|uniref:Calmodulin-binding transcription activator 2 n=1 Tax=Melia azedarach TaxID=155640 RepID=A0ACC1XX29_MELAZ|nr:Calmodulin-binding transcription activator 2 [Melia azedarach]